MTLANRNTGLPGRKSIARRSLQILLSSSLVTGLLYAPAALAAPEFASAIRQSHLLDQLDPGQDDFAHRLAKVQHDAASGDVGAEYLLGCAYTGIGLPRNLSRARHWFARAADQGNSRAAYELAYLSLTPDGDGATFLAALRRAARIGSAAALRDLGWQYELGYYVPQDDAQALHYFLDAAAMGNPGAMARVGNRLLAVGEDAAGMQWLKRAYDAGSKKAGEVWAAKRLTVVESQQDFEEAIGVLIACGSLSTLMRQMPWQPGGKTHAYWVRYRRELDERAAHGAPDALYEKGVVLHYGLGEPEDWEAAAEALSLACSKGSVQAQLLYGVMLGRAGGVPPDETAARHWLLEAAKTKRAEAYAQLAAMGRDMLRFNADFAGGPSPEAWLRYAAELENSETAPSLAAYLPRKTKHDEEDTFRWTSRAACQGRVESVEDLARCFESGTFVKRSDRQAYLLYSAAQRLGSWIVDLKIAEMKEFGRGTPQDYAYALKVYQEEVNDDHLALTKLGRMYEEGKGVPIDLPGAIKLYQQVVDEIIDTADMDDDDAEACFRLGRLYLTGRGVAKNPKKAQELFETSGSEASLMALGDYYSSLGSAEALATAYRWYYLAAQDGNVRAKEQMAVLRNKIGEDATLHQELLGDEWLQNW